MRILVVGVPRSGTTWVGTILSKCRDTTYVNEPDDERRNSFARKAKETLGRYPIIAPGDRGRVGESDIGVLEQLWKSAFTVPEFGEHVLVKSVFTPYCLEWVCEVAEVDKVLYVDRSPLNVLSSWVEYSLKVNKGIPEGQILHRLAWQYAMQKQAYQRLNAVLGSSMVQIKHEVLAVTWQLFAPLALDLGLEWTYEAGEQLNDLSQRGEGGHPGLEGYRVEQHIQRSQEQLELDGWKKRLTSEQVDILCGELARWDIVY